MKKIKKNNFFFKYNLKKKKVLNSFINSFNFTNKKRSIFVKKFKKKISINYKDIKFKKKIFRKNNIYLFKKNAKISSKLSNLFIKKIFLIILKLGRKVKIVQYYINWISIIKSKFFYKNKNKIKFNIYLNIFLINLFLNATPKVDFSIIYKKRKANFIPNFKKKNLEHSNKISILGAMWIKKALVKRKEKSLLLKFYSELYDLSLNKGECIKQKVEYYKDLNLNKKYFKYKKWI